MKLARLPGRRPEPSPEAVYRDFHRTIHGIALARVGPADTEDVVQETFLRICKGLDQVRAPEALPG